MNSNSALKEALNRQFVALGNYLPLERGMFECGTGEQVETNPSPVSFISYERVYPLFPDAPFVTEKAR